MNQCSSPGAVKAKQCQSTQCRRSIQGMTSSANSNHLQGRKHQEQSRINKNPHLENTSVDSAIRQPQLMF